MNNVQTLLKIWIDLVKSNKLQDVIEGLKINIHSQSDGNLKVSSREAFKLLLYLSHIASKCNKDYELGKKIAELASLLCSIISTIPDNERFASSLFHIIRCLLALHLYSEAKNVCSYLIKGNFNCFESKTNDILIQLTYLWHDSAEERFISLQKNPEHVEDYHEFKNIIETQLQLIRKAHKYNAKRILIKLDIYLKKIVMLKNTSIKYINDFAQYIFQHQKYESTMVEKNDKYQIYHLVLRIISRLICVKIDEDNMAYTTNILEDAFKYFKNMLLLDKECYESFLHFKATCILLLKPAEDLTEFSAKGIQSITDQYIEIVKKYGYGNTVTFTASTFAQIFEYLFLYWEKTLKLENRQFLHPTTLFEIMKFIVPVGEALMKTVSEECTCTKEQCTIRTDLYNAVALKARCIVLISKLSAKDLPKNVCRFAQELMEENISCIRDMKESNCKHWTTLWSMCGRLLYNMGATSESFYDESSYFISLLCSSIIYFEGINPESTCLKLSNPICVALYRLSNIHYNNGMYREAMTVSALHGLLSYKDPTSKAFKMWTSIKHKASKASPNLIKISMISCLKADIDKIEEIGLDIHLSEYNLIELCLSEAKGLQVAKINLAEAFDSILNELRLLKATTVQRACVIQLLGYHLLHVQENYISDCFQNIVSELESLKQKSISILCLKANLEFFIFVNELHISSEHTQTEMENTEFALHAPKLSENPESYVVPTYSKINIKEDFRLMQFLEKSLETWSNIEENIINVTQGWEPLLTLRILIVIAEYSRLYRYEECELRAWNLAIKLALALPNYEAFIYVTGRSISLRRINYKWIALAKEAAINLQDSSEENTIHVIAVFWISLADFYFECGEYTEAGKLLDDARCLPGISFQCNTAAYLYSLVTILHNSHLYKKDMNQEEYTSYIVESLYSMICLKDSLISTKWMYPEKYLFSYDILFSSTVNMSLKVNSLLSSKEIIAHLVQRLKTAQAFGATVRTAEILKSLCFIDLSRSQVDDCEVKLQGLEHILDIESIQLSMNTNLKQKVPECLTPPNHLIDPIRDTMQNDTSPVLKRKVFSLPDFILHYNCTCMQCHHTQYQYLVFASTYIRAQLYALQNKVTTALEHFHGAFKIRENLFKIEKPELPKNSLEEIDNIIKFSWQTRLYITDYVLLLLDFSYFLRTYMPLRKNEAINIALLAVDVCETHNIKNHPIYISAKELVYENYFEEATDNKYSSFTVSHIEDIDINKFTPQEKLEQKICSTPVVHNVNHSKHLAIRRNKTPPLLKLKKINLDLSDEEETNSPLNSLENTNCETLVLHTKLIRRKNSVKQYSKNPNVQNEQIPLPSTDAEKTESISIKNIISKVSPSVPIISDHLNKIADKLDIPATNEAVEKLIEMVDNLEINSRIPQRRLRSKSTSRSDKSSSDTNIKEAIALFKKMVVSEVTINDNISKAQKSVPKIIIGNAETSTISHITKRTKDLVKNEGSSSGIVASDTHSDISKVNKPQTRTTKSTRSLKSTTINKTSTAKKRSNIR